MKTQSQITNHKSPQNAIVLHNVSKKYILSKERPLLLKNLFIPSKKEEIWALKNVSLEIKKGETIGIIGENGSGKSTLLKIISGITTPTSGRVEVNGRVASLIELGAGFQPDLTGKENVYLNGTLLGLTKKEIDKKYKEIVDFADIGEFINQPVRTYSSGMTVRLGFSVAVHLDPDILLIDEVLAVGDESFQKKCIEKIHELKRKSITIIFVSHNLYMIDTICQKGLWVHQGILKCNANVTQVIQKYLNSTKRKGYEILEERKIDKKEIFIEKVILFNSNGQNIKKIFSKDFLKIRFYFNAIKKIYNPIFGIKIHNSNYYYCHGTTTSMKKNKIKMVEGKGYIDYDIKELPLLQHNGWDDKPTKYHISAFIQQEEGKIINVLDYYKNVQSLIVKENNIDQHGVISLKATWSEIHKLN